jgi:hypothetical protein
MYTPDITLDTRTYSLKSQRTASSVRSDASAPVSEPNLLTISHETAKNGRVSSVIILEDQAVITSVSTTPLVDSIKCQFKLQYNPLVGRTDVETVILDLIAKLSAGINDSAFIDKFLNQES